MTDQGAPVSAVGRRLLAGTVIRRALHGFMRHRGIDSAAALTFFGSLAVFPSALVVVSAFAIAQGRDDATESLLGFVDELAPERTVETLRDPLDQLFSIGNPWLALVLGVAVALWTLSSYATAFGRAVNTVYEVQEGRPFWKFRGLMMALAAALLLLFGALAAILLSTPRITEAFAETVGFGEPWVTAWNLTRWPLAAALLLVVLSLVYYFSPNVRVPRLRWVSWGSGVALALWGAATAGFSVYVSVVQPYDRVYGWLGTAIVLLVWGYLTNLVLVLGAEVDAEVVRARQLLAGIPAEDVLQLPARDTTRTLMLARQRADDERRAKVIRDEADRHRA